MFGYIRVQSPELKVKEYEFYRGTYCGLCRSMGKCTGQCSRMTLSYDFVFLALFRLAISGEKVSFTQKRCLAHPLKKRNSMTHNDTLAYCAGAAAILNYHKLMDDLADERGTKKLRALLARPFVARGRRKAIKHGLGELDERVAEGLRLLSSEEEAQNASVDRPAALFGEILSAILSFGLDGVDQRIAASMGMAVGKWIYIADALDDLPEDKKKNRYNPFLLLFGGLPTEAEENGIRDALKNQLYDAEAALDLLDIENPSIEHIIQNILYLGLPLRIEEIQREKQAKKSKGHKKE